MAALASGEGRADPGAITKRVARLFLRFPSSRLTDGMADATLAAYATDLAGFPLWAIDQAMMAAIQKGGAFAPSSPDLRAACERAMLPLRVEAGEIRAVLNAEVYHESSDEEQQTVRAKFDALIADLRLREPYEATRKRSLADVTPAEAQTALERMQASPEPLPALSGALREKLNLPSSEAAA